MLGVFSLSAATYPNYYTTNASPAQLSPFYNALFGMRPWASRATGPYQGTFVTNSQFLRVASGGTTGIVRSLFIMGDVSGTAGLAAKIRNVRLMCWADSNLTMTVTLADLFGARYRTNADTWTVQRFSRFIDTNAEATNQLFATEMWQAKLILPQPFTNGFYCKLTNYVDGTTWSAGYIAAEYDLYPALPPPVDTLRLYAYNTNYLPFPIATTNFIVSATGSGQIVGFMLGFTNISSQDIIGFQDSHGVAFNLNGVTWEPDGLDDFFGRTWGASLGEYIGDNAGVINYYIDLDLPNHTVGNGPGYMEAYRWLYDDAIQFTNGFTAYFNVNLDMSGVAPTLFYYRSPP